MLHEEPEQIEEHSERQEPAESPPGGGPTDRGPHQGHRRHQRDEEWGKAGAIPGEAIEKDLVWPPCAGQAPQDETVYAGE